MKNVKTFDGFVNEGNEQYDIAEVVEEFSKKYPKFANFFKEVGEWSSESFNEKLYDYFDEAEEDDDFETLWHPEAEIAMLEAEFGIDFDELTSEVWVDFHNALTNVGW